MSSAITLHSPRLKAAPPGAAPVMISLVHRVALGCVWICVASSFFVFSEPAPFDAFAVGLFILLPIVGLFDAKRGVVFGFTLWLFVAASAALACILARDFDEATRHSLVSLYLYGVCFLFAGFIAKAPMAHARLFLNAYLVAAVCAALLGIAGYFDVFPGAFELLTRHSRAAATFKDPNVFGPFLIPGLLMALHLCLVRPLAQVGPPLAAACLITLAILFSFSRGAWAASVLAVAIYSLLYLQSTDRDRQRLRLTAFAIFGTAVLGLYIAVSLQSGAVADLLQQRATLTQPYDEGPEGRFGGQEKAFALILENPFGIGAQAFTHFHHHEEAHNVYLTVLMSAGWFGGLAYIAICFGTLYLGLQHAWKRTKTRPYFIIVYAALAATIAQGYLIDTDHWRHFYMLMGITWGLMASDKRELRAARIVADVRPILMRSVLIIPPSSRGNRIVGRVPKHLALTVPQFRETRRRVSPRRPGRIVAWGR